MLRKTFLKSKCRVEFIFPGDASVIEVALAGSFNTWSTTQTPLVENDGAFRVTLELPADQEFQYRFLVNRCQWYNDPLADYSVDNGFGGKNSVVSTHRRPASLRRK